MYPNYTLTLRIMLDERLYDWTLQVTRELLEYFTKRGLIIPGEEELKQFAILGTPHIGPFESRLAALTRQRYPELSDDDMFYVLLLPSLVWHTTIHKNRNYDFFTEC